MKKRNELTFGRITLFLGVGIIVYLLVATIFAVNGYVLVPSAYENPLGKSNERIKTSIFKKGAEIQENYKQYKNDMTNSGFATLLSLDRLKQDKSHEESKNIIEKSESILSNFNQKNQAFISDLRNLLDSIKPTEKISSKSIEEMKAKFDESIEITKSIYKSDSTALSLTKEIFKVLDKCNYQINGDKLEFETMDCMFEYDNKIIELSQIQMEARTKYIKTRLNADKINFSYFSFFVSKSS